MKEIVVVSGKGGTGKTSLSASFAVLAGKEVVVADCDVDAADMHLLMQPDFDKSEDFYAGELADIDPVACNQCGKCAAVCRFDAISVIDGQHKVNSLSCEGCGYCAHVCPTNAITNQDLKVGKLYVSSIKTGSTMVHARLGIAADNSGKLVAKVKNIAKQIALEKGKKYMIVDGSPGLGCPVVSSLSGANYVVLVTEPSVSGLHDLRRVVKLVKKFNIESGCIINKSDLNQEVSRKIEDFLIEQGISLLSKLPYNESFTKAMTNGKTIVEYSETQLIDLVSDCWEKVKIRIN